MTNPGPRIFVAFNNIKENIATIEGSDINYLKNVMRLKEGDELSVMDSKSKEYSAKISKIEDKKILAELLAEKHPKSEPKMKVTIAQSIPKNPKLDLIVQKVTELGALQITPVQAERSIVKLTKEKEDARVNRWQRIAKEAAEQSGRLIIPFVQPIKEFKDLMMLRNDFDQCIMLWEMEKERSIKKFLQENKAIKNLMVLIGPEGGFSHDEVEQAKAAGFITVNIGSRIVRTETAAISVLSMIEYEFEL